MPLNLDDSSQNIAKRVLQEPNPGRFLSQQSI